MKVLFICNEYPPKLHGGIGSFTKNIAEFLTASKNEVVVVGLGHDKRKLEEIINGVRIIRIKSYKIPRFFVFKILRELFVRLVLFHEVSKLVTQINPDILESYDWSGPLIIKPTGVKLIVRLHGSHRVNCEQVRMKPSFLISTMEKFALKIPDYIIGVSDHVSRVTENVFNLNTSSKTIYTGVDTERFKDLNLERDVNQLLLVGRMHPYKGYEDLFPSLNIVFGEHKDLYLTIIGTIIDDYKAKLLSLVSNTHHSRIRFISRISNEDLPAYYNRANLSILPSRVEALPIIPLESMSCGTPVIMSDRFSAREIIDDKVDGFLVDTGNPEDLAKNILEIISDQDAINNMRKRSREKVLSKFSMQKNLNDNIAFYHKVIEMK
jgi:glycosyltransferase involved in cell wall biosynthesis